MTITARSVAPERVSLDEAPRYTPVKRRRRLLPLRLRRLQDRLVAYGLMLPSMAVFVMFFYIPAAYLIYISFFHWGVLSSATKFVGLANFRILFHQPLFFHSLFTSAYYTLVMIPATVLLSLGIALLLKEAVSRRSRGAGIWRSAVFLPHVTPVVATSIIWVWIFNPHFGLANFVLTHLGLPALGWLESVHWALPAVIIDSLWHSLGLYVIIFLAGLSTVPRELLEVARLDGAKRYYTFRRIIWPLISPTTFFVVLLATINSWQAFSQIFAMTGGPHGGAGGPAFATTTDALLVYQTAFIYEHFSLAAAMSVILFGIIMTLTLIQKWISDRVVFYR
ncbi:MAG: sugar ABC transporter permease [Actinobacteria bacterium]|nr:sugar ABC transporter permease [Actinomycetota bacterium]MCL5446504.1 sugar ABC transporter permease [Actinomycetota bacterium]